MDDDTAFRAAVERGLDDADAGLTIPYDEVRRQLLSWDTKNELTMQATLEAELERRNASFAEIRESAVPWEEVRAKNLFAEGRSRGRPFRHQLFIELIGRPA